MASEEEQSTLEQVVGAIRAIYDVRRPNSDRVELNKKIEQFKDNGDPRGVFRIAQLIICSTDYEEVVYHAGWTFLEHLIIFKWVRIDDTLRNDIQTLCFHVLSSERPLRCNMSLKTAISRCFVGIMQHEWPQNTNVFEGLQYIVTSAPEECFGQIEIVYLVVRRLLENVISMVSISNPQRRRDLSITLAAIMPRFLTDTISRLQLCMRSTNAEGAAVIAKAALEATRDIIECGTAKWLADCVESLVDLLCMYLKHPEGSVASLATRCLETLVSRKKSDEEEEIVKVLLRDSSMQAILENASLAIEASKNNPDCYEYLKAICDLLVGLGVKVAHVFETNKEPQNFVLYISAISVFFCHPATYVRGESIGALNHILSNDVLRAREDFVQIMQQRVIPDLKTAFRHSFGLGATAEDNPFDDYDYDDEKEMFNARATTAEDNPFDDYDYDDEKEMFNARAKLRHTLVPLLRSIIKDRRFSQQLNEIVRVWMDECRQCDVRTVTTECDALNRVLRIAVTCEDEESKSFYSYLFGSLLKEFEGIPKATSMSKQMELTLSFLAALIPTMSVNECPTFLAQMRETFQMKYESKETCVIKRLAIALLIRMVKSMPPESLLQIAEPLLNLVGQSITVVF
uniref:Importin N-terminal domain-containing protein n=1 Tax=Steinernema glaseri TaxID=37863 RepID=A0A1I8A028_9BILA